MSDLVLFGPLPPDSPVRLSRALDARLLHLVNRGQYVNLVGGRQMGKTTTLLWLRKAIDDQGGASAYVDLSPLGETTRDAREWVRLVASAVNDSLMPMNLRALGSPTPAGFAELQAYFVSVAASATPRRPVALIFDEVTAVPDTFRHPFFYSIRALFNLRSDVGRPLGVEPLLFVFAGCFDPDRLIPDTANSPFNIAETIAVPDFDYSLAEVSTSLTTAGSRYDAEAVLRLTGGHPYLTNRVASLGGDVEITDVAETLIGRGDMNVSYVVRTLRESDGLLALACRIASGEEVPFAPGIDPATSDLAILGVVKPDVLRRADIGGQIYRRMLELICPVDTEPIEREPMRESIFDYVGVDGLRRHLEALLAFAVENAGANPALTAVCMGVVVEGALLSVLETRTDLEALATRLNDEIDRGRVDTGLRFNEVSRPIDRWTLAQMVEVARLAAILTRPSSQISHSLREWRNLIHPAEMRRQYPDGIPDDLADAAVASGHVLLREIRSSIPS